MNCKETILREPCIQCCLKHIGQARAIYLETKKDYEVFKVFAMGHMAEAEDEALQAIPMIATIIRNERTAWELDNDYQIDWEKLVQNIIDLDLKHAAEELSRRGL